MMAGLRLVRQAVQRAVALALPPMQLTDMEERMMNDVLHIRAALREVIGREIIAHQWQRIAAARPWRQPPQAAAATP